MRDHERSEIRNLPLFAGMAEASFATLLQAAYVQSFPPSLLLAEQGQRADFLHVVVEGAVELFARWNGRETTMAIVRPVGTFILAACIKDAPYLMSARTLERSRIVLVPSSDMRAMFRADPDFAMAAMRELADCYRGAVRNMQQLKLRSARERLAGWMLQQAAGARRFVLPVEKRLLASYFGMTPENLSRALKALEPEGLKVEGNRIVLTDPDRLAALAALDPLIDGPDPDGPDPDGIAGTRPAVPHPGPGGRRSSSGP